MRKVGKKGREWIKARAKLIKNAVAENRITINEAGNISGRCEDCKRWRSLSPDHRRKRSQGGGHEPENIDWVCTECHNKRDQQGDPMGKKKTNKPNWQQNHKCKSCHGFTRQYICHLCGKVSIK